ncbi:putative reverse transcriptase domain-containing protein [Tanacetum coccineum]|uniref:Reverse transcriptase domain-containing protein n=1 Tax=Tanacetum coccineum TaxID=301880 RepID=A0ABQ4YDP9_9ASTR
MSGASLQVLRETLAESSHTLTNVDDEDLDLSETNIMQCKRKICDGHYIAVVRVLSSSGVAPYSDATLEDSKTKHPFQPSLSLPHIPIDHHPLIASSIVVLDRIKSFPRGTSCGRDWLRAQHLMDCLSGAAVAMLGEYIARVPLTLLVKPGGSIRPIDVGIILRRLVSKVSAIMIDHSLDGYLDGLQFDVGVPGGSEAILHVVNHLIEGCGDDVDLSMLLVDFKNAFNLVDRELMLREVRLRCPAISPWVEFCYSNLARLYYEEHTIWSYQGVQQGGPLGSLIFDLVLHPLICKIRDSFSLSLHAWYLDDDTIIGDTLVLGKAILYYAHMPSRVFESAQRSFNAALRSSLKRIVTASGPRFGDRQWRLSTLPFSFEGLGVYSARDVLNYAFIASQLQFADLKTKLLRHTSIVASGPIFDDALCVFNTSMETDLSSNPSEIAAPKPMKKIADIYFTRVTKNAESILFLSPRQMALWKSQREDHTFDWLMTVPISTLGQTMNACDEVFIALGWHLEEIHPGDGIATIKRRRHDIHGDDVRDSSTVSGRGRLKVDLEPSTWRRRQKYKATPSQ